MAYDAYDLFGVGFFKESIHNRRMADAAPTLLLPNKRRGSNDLPSVGSCTPKSCLMLNNLPRLSPIINECIYGLVYGSS